MEITSLQRLRDVLHLIDPHISDLPEEEEERRSEFLNKEFPWLLTGARRQSDYYHSSSPYQVNYSSQIIPRFMQLLRESVLTHQWQKALQVLERLTKEPKGTDYTIWKVGLACLLQNGGNHSRFIEQFVKQAMCLKSIAVVEVMLDYLLFLLSQSDLKEAKHLAQDLQQNTKFVDQLVTPVRKNAQVLFDAYQGLTLYAEWKLALFKEGQDDGDYFSQMLSQQDTVSRQVEDIAKGCVEYLSRLRDKPGVWDIFITRLVEIHFYYGRLEEARQILQTYRDINSSNPNSHRYLYDFETKIGGDVQLRIDALKELIKLDPCNPLALDLFNLTERSDPGAVSILFDVLDFDHCQKDEALWKALALKLEEAPESKILRRAVLTCWKTRKNWWPTMRLNNAESVTYACSSSDHNTPSEHQNENILKYKRIVCDVLKSIF